MPNAPAPHAVILDAKTNTVRPATDAGDAYYGLGPGTNGTAAICRRALVEPPGYRWLRFAGAPPTGIQYVPSENTHVLTGAPWWALR